MSLAQRRTTFDGVEALSLPHPPPRRRDRAEPEDGDVEDNVNDDLSTTTPLLTPTTNNANHQQFNGNNDDGDDDDQEEDQATLVPTEDNKEVWNTISYDFFRKPQRLEDVHQLATGVKGDESPEMQRYESFPDELGDHVAAYGVSTIQRLGQVFFAVLACVLASGIVCGFAALKPILIAEGVYSSLCPFDWPADPPSSTSASMTGFEQIPCPKQDMRLNLFFVTASITLNISTVLAGWVLDNRGRRTCYLLAAAILFLGAGLMALSFHLGEDLDKKWHFDGYIIANLLLGLGGTFLFVSSYQLANAFPRHAGIVVALVTGAFDASAAVFLFYRLAYQQFPDAWLVQPSHFFLAFALFVPLLIVVAEFTLMSSATYHSRRDYQAAIAHAQDTTRDTHASDEELFADRPPEDLRRIRQKRALRREAELEAIETVTGNAAARERDRVAARDRQIASGVDGILTGLPVSQQMRTPWFWLLLALTVVQMTRMNYFIATVRAQYRYMLGGDERLAEKVNQFFDVALPVAGVATTPFIGILLNTVPVWGTLAVLTGLIVLLGVLNCVGTLAAGYATVVAFVLFRPLYYSAVSDYATKVFGFATFGRIYGTVTCVSGAGQLIQPALDALTHGPLHDNPVPFNIIFAVLGSMIGIALTAFVYMQTHFSTVQGQGRGRGHARKKVNSNNSSEVQGTGKKYQRQLRYLSGQGKGTDEERARLLRANEAERYGTS